MDPYQTHTQELELVEHADSFHSAAMPNHNQQIWGNPKSKNTLHKTFSFQVYVYEKQF